MSALSHNNQHPTLHYSGAELERLFMELGELKQFSKPPGELSVAFLSDEQLAQLHAEFLDDPSPTDVITFPGDVEDDLAGEICVSVDMALRVSESNKGFPFSEELTLYLVHGWLHLCGLDDLDDESRAQMREAESIAMDHLRARNTIPHFSLSA